MKKIKPLLSIVIISIFYIAVSCKSETTNDEYVKKVQLKRETIAVGIYKPAGTEALNVKYIAEVIKIDAGMVYVTLSDEEILKTKLENIDVLIIPNIKIGDEISTLNSELVDVFRNFVEKSGKGILALSNGGKMIEFSNEESLNLKDIKVKYNKDASTGLINFNITSEGEEVFPELIGFNNLYSHYNSYAGFDLTKNTENQTIIAQTVKDDVKIPLIIESKYGLGKVFFIATQLESTPGMRWMIPRMIRYAQGSPNGSYGSNIVRPDLYSASVIFNDEVKNEIEQIKEVLIEGSKKEIIRAIDEIESYYPWLVAENVRPFLTGRNDDLKLRAAKFLVDNEYTLAIPDFETAIKTERSKKNKVILEEYKIALERMIEQN